MDLPTCQHFLSQMGRKAHKSLSQNFLVDNSVIQRSMELAEITPQNQVFEIGPGLGALTEALLMKGCSVTAVEKDPDLFRSLKARFPLLTLYQEDILTFDLSRLQGRFHLMGNIPYHITQEILEKFLPRYDLFDSLTLLMQKEVVLKLLSSPKNRSFGPLTLRAQLYASIEKGFLVPSSAFYPPPKVDSMTVRLHLKKPTFSSCDKLLLFIKKGFAQRRKILKNAFCELEEPLKKLSLPPLVRAEDLSLDDWYSLFLLFPSERLEALLGQ